MVILDTWSIRKMTTAPPTTITVYKPTKYGDRVMQIAVTRVVQRAEEVSVRFPPLLPSPHTIPAHNLHKTKTQPGKSNKHTRRQDAIRPHDCYPRSPSWHPFSLKENQLLHKWHYSCSYRLSSHWRFQPVETQCQRTMSSMWKSYQSLHRLTTTRS